MFDRMLPALLLFVVPNTLLANPQFQAEPRTYTARGTVVNSATGEAISGALVQLYGARQHAVLTGPGGVVAGHALALTVRASVEVSITVFDTPVTRAKDDRFGLWIIDLSV